MKTRIFTTLLATAMVATSYSQVLIYESFSQTPGALNGLAGGTGLNSWSDNQDVQVVSPTTLNYGQLENAGGQTVATNGNGTDAWVTTTSVLADNNLLDDGATLWFSFMYNKASGGSSNEWSGFGFGSERVDASFSGISMINTGDGFGVYTRDGNLTPGDYEGGGNMDISGSSSAGYTLGDSVLVVGRFDWGATAGDVDTFTLFTVDPTSIPATVAGLGAGVSKSTSAGVDQASFDTISWGIRNSGGSTIYDEIRFGANYADVSPVPEPGSFALISGFLALTSVMLRRRRS